jgi:small subunit ribosomal protein S17
MRSKKGVVISKSGDKTIVVQVEMSRTHPKYKKRYKVHSKFHAHDENNTYNVNDEVVIYETRPLSRMKRWTVTEPQKA